MSRVTRYPYSQAPSASLLLDPFAGVLTAVFDVRKRLTAYSGPCVELRRDSDDAVQDIGFTSGNTLDTAAAASFLGGANGFIRTYYNQTELGDAVQTTNAEQPAYLANWLNGLPGFDWDGTDDNMIADALASPLSGSGKSLSVFTVMESDIDNTESTFISWGNAATSARVRWEKTAAVDNAIRGSMRNDAAVDGATNIGITDLALDPHLVEYRKQSDGTVDGWVEGSEDGINGSNWSADPVTLDRFTIGARREAAIPLTAFMNGKLGGIFVFDTSQSDGDHTTIRTGLAADYGITIP